jgi:hypothetical protein
LNKKIKKIKKMKKMKKMKKNMKKMKKIKKMFFWRRKRLLILIGWMLFSVVV